MHRNNSELIISPLFDFRSPVVIYPAEEKLEEFDNKNDNISSRGISK